jgi:hypothetical protein
VGCAAEAAAGAPMAGSFDVANVPTVPEQIIFADRCGSAVCRLPQPAIANHPKRQFRRKFQRAGNGAVLPHALINRRTDVRAEAESSATNLSASALSTRVRSEQ